MCAAVSSYVHACAARGVMLNAWRDQICSKYFLNESVNHNHHHLIVKNYQKLTESPNKYTEIINATIPSALNFHIIKCFRCIYKTTSFKKNKKT